MNFSISGYFCHSRCHYSVIEIKGWPFYFLHFQTLSHIIKYLLTYLSVLVWHDLKLLKVKIFFITFYQNLIKYLSKVMSNHPFVYNIFFQINLEFFNLFHSFFLKKDCTLEKTHIVYTLHREWRLVELFKVQKLFMVVRDCQKNFLI